MYQDTERFVDLDFEQHVRQEAYGLWEADGRPLGRDKDYWFQALERCLRQRGDGISPRQDPKSDGLL